jgi:crotonobetaine/carnitine-CoA ligase
MIPRFFEEIDEFPKTPTGRVQKFLLRDVQTERCWDREPHISVTRDGVTRRTAVSGRR